MLSPTAFSVSQSADRLGHSSHRAESTPCSRLKEDHDDKTDQKGCEHNTVKTKAKLRHPIREHASRIRPFPRNTERPKQLDRFTQTPGAACHKISLEYHDPEHSHEKYQKTVSKPL